MLGILPETALASLREWLPHFSSFQVFSQATPGPSGQPFLKTVLPKIRALRESYPDRIIEVDGGVTLETARAARMAGADQCVAGTALFSAPDISEAYRALTAL
jgi:ribulose-phosphate 3-epimerase